MVLIPLRGEDMETGTYERHDIVFLSCEGKLEALKSVHSILPDLHGLDYVQNVISKVPAIVRCQNERKPDLLKVGFSWYERVQGMRFRASGEVHPRHVIRHITPWDIPSFRPKSSLGEKDMFKKFMEIQTAAEDCGLETGLFGSFAMEWLTGYPYLHSQSDLDMIVKWNSGGLLQKFYRRCRTIMGEQAADMEIYFPYWGSVKAAEWFSDSNSVLVKGFYETRIADRTALSIGKGD